MGHEVTDAYTQLFHRPHLDVVLVSEANNSVHLCCRTDLVSGVLRRKIAVVYADASQTDLELAGEVCFPNLQFNVASIEFGSVLNDTTARQQVVMTNSSKVDADFHWHFTEADVPGEGEFNHCCLPQ